MYKRKIIHLNKRIEFKDSWTYNGTLCGKPQKVVMQGINCTLDIKKVTCKLCLRMLK